MHFEIWKSLPEAERKQKCQHLDPYEDQDLFKGVGEAFLKGYGEQPGVHKVHCGLGPFLGPYNCIVVDIAQRQVTSG